MRLFFYSILLSLSISLFSQEIEKKQFAVSIWLQPNFGFRFDSEYYSFFSQNQSFKFLTNFGCDIEYSITSKLILKSGLGLNFRGVAYSYDQLRFAEPDPVVDGLKRIVTNERLYYLTIPVSIGYSVFRTEKIEIVPYCGAGAGYLMRFTKATKAIYAKKTDESFQNMEPDNLNRIALSWIIGVAHTFHLKKSYSFYFAPSYDLMLNPLNKNPNGNFKIYFWNAGCTFGVKRYF